MEIVRAALVITVLMGGLGLASNVNAAGPVAGAAFRAGASRRVITPSPLLPISGGMGAPNETTGSKGELTVRAVVLERAELNGKKLRVAIVAVDSLGVPAVLGDRARANVPGIPANNIVIGATHTHSAPDCYAFPDGQGGHTGSLHYMDRVVQEIANAVNEAINNLQPARIRVASGIAEGKIAYNYYAPDLYDRRVGVIQASGIDDKTIVTLVNYAIHPEVLGADQGICSPDLVGPLCDHIEHQVGGLAMFMNGAQGGMVTADNRNLDEPSDPLRGYWRDNRTWDECVRIGQLLANESLRIIAMESWQTSPMLRCCWERVNFPVESDTMWRVVVNSPLNYPHDISLRSITSTINLVQLGNAQILTIPGEALPNIGFYLKRKMGGDHNFLFGLTNDAFGYIMCKVDFASFPRYDYISRTSLGEQTGEILIDAALRLVDSAASFDSAAWTPSTN